MIRPLSRLELGAVLGTSHRFQTEASPLPRFDRAFEAVEAALATLGIEDPASLRTPRPVEEALHNRALPEGTLLILDPAELRAAEVDIEDTVKDERQGGSVYITVPSLRELPSRARGIRELASSTPTFGLHGGYAGQRRLDPRTAQRLGKVQPVHTGRDLGAYRILFADTPGFRVALVARDLPGGGFVGLWSGNEQLLDELREVLVPLAVHAGHDVPSAAPEVPELEGIEDSADVWRQAEELRAYRTVREAELREIARQAALRGVALRREREARRKANAAGRS